MVNVRVVDEQPHRLLQRHALVIPRADHFERPLLGARPDRPKAQPVASLPPEALHGTCADDRRSRRGQKRLDGLAVYVNVVGDGQEALEVHRDKVHTALIVPIG